MIAGFLAASSFLFDRGADLRISYLGVWALVAVILLMILALFTVDRGHVVFLHVAVKRASELEKDLDLTLTTELSTATKDTMVDIWGRRPYIGFIGVTVAAASASVGSTRDVIDPWIFLAGLVGEGVAAWATFAWYDWRTSKLMSDQPASGQPASGQPASGQPASASQQPMASRAPQPPRRGGIPEALVVVAVIGLLAVAFAVGVAFAPPPPIAVKRSPDDGWVEVYREGVLQSEWNETEDPDIWPLLDRLLRDAPELYHWPKPRVPPAAHPRGRGPKLEKAMGTAPAHPVGFSSQSGCRGCAHTG